MDEIARLSEDNRRDLFNDSATTLRTTPAVVEKDFWVTWVLSKIFQDPFLSKHLVFKGGTSLSKVYELIERFSEDIDLVLNWYLITNENPEDDRSKTKQATLNQQLVNDADDYIKKALFQNLSAQIGNVCELVAGQELCVINVNYPSIFDDKYLSPNIKLEIGPLASMLPSVTQDVSSYVATTHAHLFKQSHCPVRTIKAERTFWEKVLILHQEHHRPEHTVQPKGYSRHFYDVARMAASSIKQSALLDNQLKDDVISFKQKYYPRSWARYDLAKLGQIKLVPQAHVLKATQSDYVAMREMFFGDVPTFDELIATLTQLETEINPPTQNQKRPNP